MWAIQPTPHHYQETYSVTTRQEYFKELFEPLRESLWRFVRAMVFKYDSGDMEMAKDLMSETILQTLERFDELRDSKALLAFCFTVASRLYKQQFIRRKFWGLYSEEVESQMRSDNTMPDAHTDIRLLYEALDKLPLKTREALILFELSDVSLNDIQRIQGGTLSAVKLRLVRGRKQLAILLGADNQNDEETHSESGVSTESDVIALFKQQDNVQI
jgi:RNA polymerase sigma-70 factor, ECF subfamily